MSNCQFPHRILIFALLVWLICGNVIPGLWTLPASGEPGWPSFEGAVSEENGSLALDLSHLTDGYFLACAPQGCSHRLKLRVEKEEQTLTYDLNGEGKYEIFPLQLGSGDYTVSLYENVGGKKYAQQGTVTLTASLSAETAPFVYPNQYVHYTEESSVVELSASLCDGKNEKEAYNAIEEFMSSSFAYDFVRAVTISPGELPQIDPCVEKHMGICQDLSAVMVSLLRLQGIPSRLMIGYADDTYHAWTLSDVDGEEVFFDPTAALHAIAKPAAYSLERWY